LTACATASPDDDSGGNADAALNGAPDASITGFPDASITGFPDARVNQPDAAPGSPDAMVIGTPDAGGGPTQITLSHSSSMAITATNSVACTNSTTGYIQANGYYRVFNLSSMGVVGPLTVSQVSFGIEEATAGIGTTQPAYVNLFTLNGALLFANMTQLHSQPVTVSNTTSQVFNASMPNVVVPANSTLVVEVFTPNGETDGNVFFIGSNTSAESSPSYLAAPDCSLNEPSTVDSIGYPDMHIVMSVTGTHNP
jgi:hypothetical protein